jgi:thioredoxin 1
MEQLALDAFDGRTLRRDGRYAVVFSADWCPFCRAFSPKFATLDGNSKFRTAQVDLTDLETPLWEQFEIEVVPSIIAFRDGEVILRIDGVAGVGLSDRDVDRTRAMLSS